VVAKGVKRVEGGHAEEGDEPQEGENGRQDGGRGAKLLHGGISRHGLQMRTENTSHATHGQGSKVRGRGCCP
jgi:hypothetical protein